MNLLFELIKDSWIETISHGSVWQKDPQVQDNIAVMPAVQYVFPHLLFMENISI